MEPCRVETISTITGTSWKAKSTSFYIDGHWVTLTQGHRQRGGLYLDAKGRVIARDVTGGSLVVDMDALDHARSQSSSDRNGKPPNSNSPDDGRGPKLCPDATREPRTTVSKDAIAYQEYVTGLIAGLAVTMGGVRFDGCRETDGAMLEAKANYAFFLDRNGNWRGWGDEALNDIKRQMREQSNAAAIEGRSIEWHVKQEAVADIFRDLASNTGLANLTVIFDPGP